MEREFNIFYISADSARTEIFNNLRKANPFMKFWELCKRYSPWDEKALSHEYFKIPNRNGLFMARFTHYNQLEIWAKFKTFTELGTFIDRVTADKNAVIDINDEAWKLYSVETSENLLFLEDEKYCEAFINYKLVE